MTDTPLHALLAALTAEVVRSPDIGDARPAAALKHGFLQQRILSTYRDQLEGLAGDEQFGWLIERVAGLEARMLALQAALPGGGARRPEIATEAPVPGTAGAAPPDPRETDADKLPDRVLVACDEIRESTGLYPTEGDERGRLFRWLGPGTRSRIYLPRVAAPFELRVSVYSIYAAGSVESARFSVDGGAWDSPIAEGKGENIVLRCRPKPGVAHNHERMTLDIEVSVMDSPANHGSDDDRRLSFALSRLELVPV